MSFLSTPSAEVAKNPQGLGWVPAGLTLFAFAAPSAVQSAPFFIGGTGVLAGSIFCIVSTMCTVAGSWMLLQVKLQFPLAHNFGELGYKVLGPVGRFCGNFIQLGNFVLFLPCALLFTGQALQGIGYGISAFDPPGGAPCWDYYIFVIAIVCFMTTQLRTLNNTAIFSALSVLSVAVMAVVQLSAAFSYEVVDKQPALWFGNPAEEHSFVLWQRAATICVFGYVPSFLTAELASCMKDPKEMTKSLVLSGVLNVVMMLGVGITVVSCWGYNMGYVVGLTGQFAGTGTAKVAAWNAGNVTTTTLQTFALCGNFVSYMLDSVPLGRYCQQVWAPRFRDTWSCGDIAKYAAYTLPCFVLGLLLVTFLPSLDFLIGVVTFATTPWVTMIFPSVLYWRLFAADRKALLNVHLEGSAEDAPNAVAPKSMSTAEKWGVALVFLFGVLSVAISAVASLGQLAIEGTSSWQIGCEGWYILKPH